MAWRQHYKNYNISGGKLMSGGSMGHLYRRILGAVDNDSNEYDEGFLKNTELRKLFATHLRNVAAALKAIEWNDSGDGADDEDMLIVKCLCDPSER
jgi:hypothetical protein